METKENIAALVAKTLEGLAKEQYTVGYIRELQVIYDDLRRYMESKGASDFSMSMGLDYLRDTFGANVDGFYGKHPPRTQFPMRALQILWDFKQYGFLMTKARPVNGPFECPAGYREGYDAFLKELINKGNALKTRNDMSAASRKFIQYLTEKSIHCYDGITSDSVNAYITTYAGCQPSYLAAVTRRLRYFLHFVYEQGYMQYDISKAILPAKSTRSRMLPSTWTEEELHQTLGCIDRESMTGKRDYAIVLLVARLGLRAGDVCELKITDVDWKARRISIVMHKTKQILNLPLLEDVGWALIDYLKNARPQTNSPHLFVRRVAPYTKLDGAGTLSTMVGWYLNKAGVDVRGRRHGLHSFRNSLAKAMLESGASLPVISEVLGHHNIQTTSIYLSVDTEGLKNCVIDPEGVFNHDA